MDRSQFDKIIQKAHRFDIRVYWEDTDGEGIVYYANHLKFAERARTESLRESGFQQQQLFKEHGIMFVVHRCAVTYHAPARLDDVLRVYSHFYDIGLSRLRGIQLITKDDNTLIAELEISLVCLNRDHYPDRMPDTLRQTLQNHTKRIE